jgi:L-lactate utilization protein LutC
VRRDVFLRRVAIAVNRTSSSPVPSPPHFEPALPAFVNSANAMRQVFLDRQMQLGVVATAVRTRHDAQVSVERLLSDRGWDTIACDRALCWRGILEMRVESALEASFGLCEARYAIAETGSVVLNLGGGNKRETSLLPQVVGFFIAASRLVPRLGDVLRNLGGNSDDMPSCLALVTGPSASADIVGIRAVGVHGPGEVWIWLIESE